GDRFCEVGYGAEVERVLPLLGAGNYVHRNVGGRRIVLELLQQAPAVGIGQADVERDCVGTETPRQCQALRGRERDDAFETTIPREPEQNPREDEVVFDDEQHAIDRLDPLAVVLDLAVRVLFGGRARHRTDDALVHAAADRNGSLNGGGADVALERMEERKRAAFADRAAHVDFAAEQRRNLAADRQAEAGAAETAR